MERYIYILKDPTTKEVVYVGETSQLSVRYKSHKWGVQGDSDEKKAWVKRLKKEGLQPIVEILDTAKDKRDAMVKENALIVKYIIAGCKLFNIRGAKRLKQYDSEGNLVGEYFDTKEATEKTGIRSFHIGRGLDGGFLFTYGNFNNELFIKEKNRRKAQMKAVTQVDQFGNIVMEFEGVREAGRITGISHKSIAQVAGGSEVRKSAGGFKWIYN
jgi:predicted GIY-YIG superfamily endonuclease